VREMREIEDEKVRERRGEKRQYNKGC